jgi:hypothetical protein
MEMITPGNGKGTYNNIGTTKFVMFTPVKQVIKTDKIALIDADYLKYLVAYDIHEDIKKGKANLYKDPVHKYSQKRVDAILGNWDCKGVIFCFSGASENTFRASVAFDKVYKGSRDYTEDYDGQNADKKACYEYIKDRYPTLKYNDLEADDLVVMLHDEDTFIVAQDKDALQSPGTHYNLKTDELYEITPEQGFRFLMTQMVTGDSVDNIPGIKGVGQKWVESDLDHCPTKDMAHMVMSKYMTKNKNMSLGIDRFCENWMLLKMRTNRGDHFLSKYRSAFDLLTMLKLQK